MMQAVQLKHVELDHQFSELELLNVFRSEIGADEYSKWLSNLTITLSSESELTLSAPSKFVRDWVMREFVETKKLIKAAKKLNPQLKKLSVIYLPKAEELIAKPGANIGSKIANLSKHDNVFAFGTELNPRFTFKNFVSAKYNKLATSMAQIAAGIDNQISLFDDKIPLFIHGGVGLGKTHLAQAIAWNIKDLDSSKKVVYLSAEKFMYHFVQSLRNKDIMNFKEKMRGVDVLIVDDVQFIAGKESTQQEFMNCFNALVEDNKQVVLVCDRCPSNLENIDEKLKSRITGGMIVNFKNPDFADRLEILKAKAEMHGEAIDENILQFIAEKITSSVRDLEGAIKKLIASKVFEEKEITLEHAKVLLSSYFKQSQTKAVSVEKIQKAVAAFYDIKISDLTSSSRLRSIARPRQIAMYLAKSLTSDSLPKIGASFGGKNHATVIHSVKLITKMIEENSQLMSEVKALAEKLAG
jgi:chromosomal replication initiator protein